MGISTQSAPFKPCTPSSFWFSPSCRRSASTTSMASSSHAFPASPKAFHRRELHSLRSACGPGSNINVFSSSLQFKRGSSNSTRPFIVENAMRMIDKTEHYCLPHWKLVVRVEQSNPCTSSARMFPYYPSRIGSEEKHFSGGSLNLRRVGQEKNQTPRCFHVPLTREAEVLPNGSYSDDRSPSEAILPRGTWLEDEKKKTWLDEAKRLRAAKEEGHSIENCRVRVEIPPKQVTLPSKTVGPKGLQDGSGYEKVDYSTNSFCCSGILQSPFSRKDMGYDSDQAQRSPPKLSSAKEMASIKSGGKSTLGSPLINDNRASHVTVSNELGLRRHNDIGTNKSDHTRQTGSSSTQFLRKDIQSNGSSSWDLEESKGRLSDSTGDDATERDSSSGKSDTIVEIDPKEEYDIRRPEHRERLNRIYDKVLIVDNISDAKKIVGLLTTEYRHLVHACDTEVAKIDVKKETPVDHGEVICFSIYSGPQVNFGNGKSCIWVDVLDGGGRDLLTEFAPFFEDPSIKKVWHNYSFDSHVIENYGLKLSGFHADTMHMARLWDSSRRTEGGYSLEALTCNPKVMSEAQPCTEGELIGKISMKTIFGKRRLKKDGSLGKHGTIAPVEELQKEERILWICYSALDSISTLMLFESLKKKLQTMKWVSNGDAKGFMYNFYEEYWRPFGELLVKMETEGMLVNRAYLADMEKVATVEQKVASNRFRNWASRYCPDALYMNVGSDAQLRQIFFGGTMNRKDPNGSLPVTRIFKVPNVDKVIEEGKKVATKFRNITLCKLGDGMQTEIFTASGWPSVSGDALKTLAGKVSAEYNWTDDDYGFQSDDSNEIPPELGVDEADDEKQGPSEDLDTSAYGTAYLAFGGGKEGREACHAIAALCEVCSIDSLISNFILPLQSSHISGKNGRIHCSLNINTETGRLSARRPNLQNQPALEKDRYKIRQAFIAAPGNSLIVADYGQLELRILAHLANCKSMLDAFKAGGDFHSRTAMNMYPHIREAVEQKRVLLEWHPQPGEEIPPVPLLKDAFASERRKAKMLNFSIAYGKTPIGLARDWKVSVREARETVDLWYKERKEVLAWQEKRKKEAHEKQCVHTLLGRARCFPSMAHASNFQRGHIERAAINTPVQGSAADVAMCAMLEISRNARLKELGWRLLLQVHDEVILEGPTESAEVAKAIVVECMSKPFNGKNFLKVGLSVDAKCAQNWYAAK